DDGMSATETGGVGMYFEPTQNPPQNLPLHKLELRDRREDFPEAFAALGDLKLDVGDRDGRKLGRTHFQALGDLLDAAAGLFFARVRRRTSKPVEKSHRNALRRRREG